jgi:hypothetical protein
MNVYEISQSLRSFEMTAVVIESDFGQKLICLLGKSDGFLKSQKTVIANEVKQSLPL